MKQQTFAGFPETAHAILSECRTYRYVLYRSLDGCAWDAPDAPGLPGRPQVSRSRICYVLTNPSTADEHTNDPTVEKVIKQSTFFGAGLLSMVNAFAYRETDSRKLPHLAAQGINLVGPENDRYIMQEILKADLVICGWGNPGALLERDKRLRELITYANAGGKAYCIRENKNRTPIHPLYQLDQPTLVEFRL